MRAWTSIPVLLLGSILTALSAGAAGRNSPSAAATDSCGPSYLDIYNFQVGDVFQYSGSGSSTGGGGFAAEESVRKEKIISKTELAGGYRYVITGLAKSRSVYPREPWGYGSYDDTVEFNDSTERRILNACGDQIVPMPYPFEPGNYALTDRFTRVHKTVGDTFNFRLSSDTMQLKILGTYWKTRPGSGFPAINLYRDSAGRVADSGTTTTYTAAYAAGLGKVAAGTSGWEGGGTSESLTGYVRNGITHGTVQPDSAFGVTDTVLPAARPIKAVPGPSRFTGIGPLFLSHGGPGWSDLLGRASLTESPRPFRATGLPGEDGK